MYIWTSNLGTFTDIDMFYILFHGWIHRCDLSGKASLTPSIFSVASGAQMNRPNRRLHSSPDLFSLSTLELLLVCQVTGYCGATNDFLVSLNPLAVYIMWQPLTVSANCLNIYVCQEICNSIGVNYLCLSQAVQAVNLSHDLAHAQMDVKFRSLICCGLK